MMSPITSRLSLGSLLFAALLYTLPSQSQTGITERVNVSSDGSQANGFSGMPSISGDGRYIAFHSSADNLVPDDTNNEHDVFVHDRVSGTTARVSVSSTGEQALWGSCSYASISADGRYVAFQSPATNLVPDGTNRTHDIIVKDLLTGTTERASVSSDGERGNDMSVRLVSISADGSCVAFVSHASNLTPGDTNEVADIFVRDRAAGTTSRVSVSSSGAQGNAQSWWTVSISGDGRYVAFQSEATNLVPNDTNGVQDVFVHDRVTGTTERVSVSSDGTEANSVSDLSSSFCLSHDGKYVVFDSAASNLVAGDTNGNSDAFVHDRVTGTTECVSMSLSGEPVGGSGHSITADGRYVAFQSGAGGLVPDDTNNKLDVFVHDRHTRSTEMISVSSDGGQGDDLSAAPVISADGRYVVFWSHAANLVPGDTNAQPDMFVRDYEPQELPVGDVIYVDSNISGYQDGMTWTTALTTIQSGIDMAFANGGGEVWVADGVYDEVRTSLMHDPAVDTGSVLMKPGVHVYGGFAGVETEREHRDHETNVTIIDGSTSRGGEAAYHVVVGADNATLDGFTVTGGHAEGWGPDGPGSGGGLFNYEASPTIKNCTFTENTGTGIFNGFSNPVIENCIFSDNTGFAGGGIFNGESAPTVTGCTFINNEAGEGAGICNWYCSPGPTVIGCMFIGNHAGSSGGGIYDLDASSEVINCVFIDNVCDVGGGGMECGGSSATLINCTFAGNTGQTGGAVYCWDSSLTITNCIMWGGSPEEIHVLRGSEPLVTYSDIQGGYAGLGNIDADPLFADLANGDLSLADGSPCIDTGTSAGAPDADIRDVARPQGAGVDIGAYEKVMLLTATVSGRVFRDSGDRNHTYESGEGVGGAQVSIFSQMTDADWDREGSLIATTITDDSGWFEIGGLGPDAVYEIGASLIGDDLELRRIDMSDLPASVDIEVCADYCYTILLPFDAPEPGESRVLSYMIHENVPIHWVAAITKALNVWASVSREHENVHIPYLQFELTDNWLDADIGFNTLPLVPGLHAQTVPKGLKAKEILINEMSNFALQLDFGPGYSLVLVEGHTLPTYFDHSNEIDKVRTILHEIGHALGLGHIIFMWERRDAFSIMHNGLWLDSEWRWFLSWGDAMAIHDFYGPSSGSSLAIIAMSPVDLSVSDPGGNMTTRDENGIPHSQYFEGDQDHDGEPDDIVMIYEPGNGTYSVSVVPEENLDPKSTLSLYVAGRDGSVAIVTDLQAAYVRADYELVYTDGLGSYDTMQFEEWLDQFTGVSEDQRGFEDDPDSDALTNFEEFSYQTDPAHGDTDRDALSDGDEIKTYYSDPADTDTDGDGLYDGDEVHSHGTSPIVTDTDQDGFTDRHEILENTDPLDGADTPAFAFGDVNTSESVDAVDVQLVINEALGLSTGHNCDLNADAAVNAVDVQLVINVALGII